MDFRVEEEIKVIRKVIKHVYGPCLMCDRETKYGNRIPRLGIEWLRKEFEPTARKRNFKAVQIGVAPKARSLAMLEELVCDSCRAGLLKVRWAASDERGAVLQRRAKRSARYHASVDV